jgi:hypothetical protein
VTGNRNTFAVGQSSCEFQRAREDDGACPSGHSPITIEGNGQFNGLTLYGCSSGMSLCYSQATVGRLRELGYDVSNMPVCGQGA